MATTNNITGDAIITKPSSSKYRDNFDFAFRPKRYLYLDDVRIPEKTFLPDEMKYLTTASEIPAEKWEIVRSYDAFVEWIQENGIPHIVSFDNDLCVDHQQAFIRHIGTGAPFEWEFVKTKMGIHCAIFLKEYCQEQGYPIPLFFVHSANESARPIIREILKN
jgi:hypothetical protein